MLWDGFTAAMLGHAPGVRGFCLAMLGFSCPLVDVPFGDVAEVVATAPDARADGRSGALVLDGSIAARAFLVSDPGEVAASSGGTMVRGEGAARATRKGSGASSRKRRGSAKVT